MELWKLQSKLDNELSKAEGQRDYRFIDESCQILGAEYGEGQ